MFCEEFLQVFLQQIHIKTSEVPLKIHTEFFSNISLQIYSRDLVLEIILQVSPETPAGIQSENPVRIPSKLSPQSSSDSLGVFFSRISEMDSFKSSFNIKFPQKS